MDQPTALVLTAAITAAPAILAIVMQGGRAKARQVAIAKTVTETAQRGRANRTEAEKRAKAVATVLDDIKDQVATLNGKTLGALADAVESRRVDLIPPADRSGAEAEHLDVVPVPPDEPRRRPKRAPKAP